MPRYRFIILWAFLVLSPTAQVTWSGQVPISVTINAPSSEAKAGSELKLGIALTNTSDKQVDLTTWPEDSKVDVIDSQGRIVGKIQGHKESMASPKVPSALRAIQGHGSSQGLRLAPQDVIRLQEDLSKDFDLSKPGKYTVQAARMYGKTAVKSNTITITVVP